jgi:hypothetical protein
MNSNQSEIPIKGDPYDNSTKVSKRSYQPPDRFVLKYDLTESGAGGDFEGLAGPTSKE